MGLIKAVPLIQNPPFGQYYGLFVRDTLVSKVIVGYRQTKPSGQKFGGNDKPEKAHILPKGHK